MEENEDGKIASALQQKPEAGATERYGANQGDEKEQEEEERAGEIAAASGDDEIVTDDKRGEKAAAGLMEIVSLLLFLLSPDLMLSLSSGA